jgi:hypothetical protein
VGSIRSSYYPYALSYTFSGAGTFRAVVSYSISFSSSVSSNGNAIHIFCYDSTSFQNIAEIQWYAPGTNYGGNMTCTNSGISLNSTFTGGGTYTFNLAVVPTANGTMYSLGNVFTVYQIPA